LEQEQGRGVAKDQPDHVGGKTQAQKNIAAGGGPDPALPATAFGQAFLEFVGANLVFAQNRGGDHKDRPYT
jgi:hypothetical protein